MICNFCKVLFYNRNHLETIDLLEVMSRGASSGRAIMAMLGHEAWTEYSGRQLNPQDLAKFVLWFESGADLDGFLHSEEITSSAFAGPYEVKWAVRTATDPEK